MIMGCSGGRRGYNRQEAVWRRFFYAIRGIVYGFQTERNLRFHGLAAVLVVGLALFFRVSRTEWLVLFLTVGAVIALELVNSAVERTVDLVTRDYHELAEAAKDLAAGAVLVMAMISVLVGICIFGPYIVQWLSA